MTGRAGAPQAGGAPIHIGGLDRSGKTTMQAFLTSHPNIAIPDVGSNMWTYFYRRYGDLAHRGNFERCLEAMLRYTHVRCLDPDPARIRSEFWRGPPTYARLFSLFLSHYAERKGKPRWGAQTGLIERYADEILASYAGGKIVHMVRDPRDRYEASRSLWPEGKGLAGGAIARWNYSFRLGRRNMTRHPEDYLIVRFEDLVADPEGTLRGVCEFLGEPFVPEMMTMSGAPERRDKLMSRIPKGEEGALLSNAFVGRFRGRVKPAELRFIQLHARRGMRVLGYAPLALETTVAEQLRFAALEWPSQFSRLVAWRSVEWMQQRFPSRVPRHPSARTLVPQPAGEGR